MPEDDEGSKKAEAAGKPREESSISMSTLGQLEEEEEARQQQQLEQEQSSAAQRHRTELNLQQRPAQQAKDESSSRSRAEKGEPLDLSPPLNPLLPTSRPG
jgi:hypothetical protein